MTRRSRIMLAMGMMACVCMLTRAADAEDGTLSGEQGSFSTATSAEGGLEPAGSEDGTGRVPSEATTALDRAEELFGTADVRYAAGDVAGALAAMEESYALSRSPELLFNLGQLNRELERCREALAYYRQYLKEMPGGSGAQDARAAVGALAPQCETPPPAAAVPVLARTATAAPPVAQLDHPPARDHYWSPWRITGWSAILAGAGLGAGALYFTLRTDRLEDQAEAKGNHDPEIWKSGERSETVARAMAVLAASATVGGALLLWVGHQNPTTARAVSLGVRADGLSTSWSLRF